MPPSALQASSVFIVFIERNMPNLGCSAWYCLPWLSGAAQKFTVPVPGAMLSGIRRFNSASLASRFVVYITLSNITECTGKAVPSAWSYQSARALHECWPG